MSAVLVLTKWRLVDTSAEHSCFQLCRGETMSTMLDFYSANCPFTKFHQYPQKSKMLACVSYLICFNSVAVHLVNQMQMSDIKIWQFKTLNLQTTVIFKENVYVTAFVNPPTPLPPSAWWDPLGRKRGPLLTGTAPCGSCAGTQWGTCLQWLLQGFRHTQTEGGS